MLVVDNVVKDVLFNGIPLWLKIFPTDIGPDEFIVICNLFFC